MARTHAEVLEALFTADERGEIESESARLLEEYREQRARAQTTFVDALKRAVAAADEFSATSGSSVSIAVSLQTGDYALHEPEDVARLQHELEKLATGPAGE